MSIRGSVLQLDWSKVSQWAEFAIAPDTATVQVRLRNNHLYLLYEAPQGLAEQQTVSKVSQALQQNSFLSCLPGKSPALDKIFLSGRKTGSKLPDWTVKLDYHQAIQPDPPQHSSEETVEAIQPTPPPPTVPTPQTPEKGQKTKSHSGSPPPPKKNTQPLSTRLTQWFSRSSSSHSAAHPDSTVSAGESDYPSELDSDPPTPDPKPIALNVGTQPKTVIENSIVSAPTNLSSPSSALRQPLVQPVTENIEKDVTENVPTVSTEALARQGHPNAIATHLSQILGGLGVSVKVRRRNLSRRRDPEAAPLVLPKQRLWVLCESAYSPDPSLLAEPISQKLRELQLENYQDACILLQVKGEPKPDWMLRVDLTPKEKILKAWGKWGDALAIAALLNQRLSPQQLTCRATLKESTLHIVCYHPSAKPSQSPERPDQFQVMGIITPVLKKLAPQGIQAATVYGVEETKNNTDSDTPLWIDWLNLPAKQRLNLQPSALTLAQQGDISALKFLISRLINPNLEVKLATGGIRVMLLRKGNLLHVMTQGPTCPSQSKMVPPIVQFLRTAEIQDLTGARIYGRRSGQKSPLWRYRLSLESTQTEPTTAQMEFAPPTTEADELAGQAGELVFRPNLPLIHLDTEEDSLSETESASPGRNPLEVSSVWLQQRLMATGLFSTADPVSMAHQSGNAAKMPFQKAGLAVAWGALGCFLVWQADLIFAQLIQAQGRQSAVNSGGDDSLLTTTASTPTPEMFSATAANVTQIYPTFNSPQLDEQLARYQNYIARHQQPPDILIIGSSRALRGVDPAVLEQELKRQGYGGLKVFNFGVNGATLQVVDLILRRVLPPEQLPQLILIADGVRAVNSGRVDRTYDSIAQSEAYQQVAEGTLNLSTGELAGNEVEPTTTQSGWLASLGINQSSIALAQWEPAELKQHLTQFSSSYSQRSQLKQVLQSTINQQVMVAPQATPDVVAAEVEDQLIQNIPTLKSNGFLPMSEIFEPQTYYEKYSLVSGYYDGDYQGFDLVGEQMTALNNLLEYIQPMEIEVVFVNMPLTSDYLDEVRWDYEQVFIQQMQQQQAQNQITFINLGSAWPNQYNYFSDPSHLNQYGAAAVSQRLAQESQIPWPR